jgi:cell division septation protein DedD
MAESRFRSPADNADDAPRAGGAASRATRVEDPLAELARLIGQEDPFKDFYKDEAARIVAPPAEPVPLNPPDDSWYGSPQPASRYGSAAAPTEPVVPLRPAIDPLARVVAADPFERLARPSQAAAKSDFDQAFGQDAFGRNEPLARPDPVAVARQAPPAAAAQPRSAYDDPYRRHDDDAEYDRDYGAEEQAYDPYYSEDGHMPPHGEGLEEAPRSRSRMVFMLVGAVLGLAALGTGGVFAYRSLAGGGEPPTIKADTGPNKVASTTSQQPDPAGQKLIYDRVGAPGSTGAEQVVSREEQPVDLKTQPRVVLPGAVDAASGGEPRKVRTMVVRSDGTVVPSAPPAAAPAPAQPAIAQPATPRPVAPAPAPAATAPAQPQRTASVSGSGFVVQVSAARSEAEAKAALRSVQSKYPNVLGGQPTSVRKVDLERGTFYRAHIGPYASREQANDVCNSLRSAGGDCIVQQRN